MSGYRRDGRDRPARPTTDADLDEQAADLCSMVSYSVATSLRILAENQWMLNIPGIAALDLDALAQHRSEWIRPPGMADRLRERLTNAKWTAPGTQTTEKPTASY